MSREATDRLLAGRRVVVTRAAAQAAPLLRLLAAEGAEAIPLPAIETVPPASWEPVDRALARLEDYDWLIFTSTNGVKFFLERLRERGCQPELLANKPILSVGPKTAAALAKYGLQSELIPEKFQGEGIVAALADRDIRRQRFLLPRAQVAREIVPETLRQRGASVEVLPVYRTILPPATAERLAELCRRRPLVDFLTFTSSSTVSNLVEHCPSAADLAWLQSLPAACIGPVTAATARQAGLRVVATAREYTIEGLIAAMKAWLAGGDQRPTAKS
ncbi:MAG: uroporphyrinogen-III synthase [Deltaproteobacteria bacterium]|nr:uroporphyrinogen-III synthase [Deltaproteobacteria bacterium]